VLVAILASVLLYVSCNEQVSIPYADMRNVVRVR
jgi:hypothetical protein